MRASSELSVQLSGHDIISLRGGAYAAAIAPSAGGRVASLRWARRGLSRPLLVQWKGDAFDEHAWPKAGALPTSSSPIVARISRSDYRRALIAFRGALPLAQLGRADEAQQAYAEGIKHLGPAPTAERPRDLGKNHERWYLAEVHRREAEQALRSKGITVP